MKLRAFATALLLTSSLTPTLSAQAQVPSTKAALIAQLNACIFPNTQNLITPACVNALTQAIITSMCGLGQASDCPGPVAGNTYSNNAVLDSTSTVCNTNSATAVQAAVNAAPAGATIVNTGWTCLKSSVVISKPGQKIACLGGASAGGHHDVGTDPTAPAGYIWGGAVNQPMFVYKSATTQSLYGNGMDCALNGNGVASVGVQAWSTRNGQWHEQGSHFTTTIHESDIDTSLAEANGSNGNEYWIYGNQTLSNDGSFFVCNGTASWDCSQDNFYIGFGIYSGKSPTMVLNGADSEHVYNWTAYDNLSGGSAYGIYLSASNNIDTARNNDFWGVGFSNTTHTVYAEGTENGKSTPSGLNNIYQYDSLDSPYPPFIGTAATLYWAAYTAPPGLNYYTRNGQTIGQESASGVITNSGVTGSVAALGSVTFTFSSAWNPNAALGTQLKFPSGCLSATVAPNAAISGWHTACVPGSPTTFTIYNDSSTTAAAFYWSVSGY